MPKVFISYRRADSRKDAGRIYDRLVEAFGRANIFKDVDNIPYGRDFRGVLSEAVNQCDVMLAVIGHQWLDIADEQGNRRLDNPADFVRIEIQSGLQRGDARCLVIPVLVDGAAMPNADKLPLELRELAFKNAITVRDDPDFHRDMERLVRQLQQFDTERKAHEKAEVIELSRRATSLAANRIQSPLISVVKSPVGIAVGVLIIALGLFLLSQLVQRAANTPTPTTAALVASNTLQVTTSLPTETTTQTSAPTQSAAVILTAVPTDTSMPTISPTPFPPTAILTETPTNTPTPSATLTHTPSPTATTLPTQTPVPVVIHNADWKPVEKDINGVTMVHVPIGCFDMGNDPEAYDGSALGVGNGGHICFDKPFWIDKTEVTNAQFVQFKGQAAQPSHWTDPNRPRETITWMEARDFCELRSGRLPTEAEWEYAARGPDDLIYPWGNDFNADYVIYSGNSNNQTASVGSKPSGASWVGAFDISGNVLEWVSTLYIKYPYPTPGSVEESDKWLVSNDTTNARTWRGGSWHFDSADLRAADRFGSNPFSSDFNLGFRCVVSAPIS